MSILQDLKRSAGDPVVVRSGPGSVGPADRSAKALGWFGISLGLVELISPRFIARRLGMEGLEAVIRAYGAREVASGLLVLSPDKKVGLWSRVAGDVLDVATLVTAIHPYNRQRGAAKLALGAVLAVTVVDVLTARRVSTTSSRGTPLAPLRRSQRLSERVRGNAAKPNIACLMHQYFYASVCEMSTQHNCEFDEVARRELNSARLPHERSRRVERGRDHVAVLFS